MKKLLICGLLLGATTFFVHAMDDKINNIEKTIAEMKIDNSEDNLYNCQLKVEYLGKHKKKFCLNDKKDRTISSLVCTGRLEKINDSKRRMHYLEKIFTNNDYIKRGYTVELVKKTLNYLENEKEKNFDIEYCKETAEDWNDISTYLDNNGFIDVPKSGEDIILDNMNNLKLNEN